MPAAAAFPSSIRSRSLSRERRSYHVHAGQADELPDGREDVRVDHWAMAMVRSNIPGGQDLSWRPRSHPGGPRPNRYQLQCYRWTPSDDENHQSHYPAVWCLHVKSTPSNLRSSNGSRTGQPRKMTVIANNSYASIPCLC
jgi:hypothetical protein